MELERRLILNYTDLQEFFAEVCGELPTDTRDDVEVYGGYPFVCILAEDSDSEFISFYVYLDDFAGALDA